MVDFIGSIKIMNRNGDKNEEEMPNFCPRCRKRFVIINLMTKNHGIIKDAYRECPICGRREEK
ncbi:hypothetical protein K8R61_01575 [bacterium]|nr:hypothetical protein [bacterium]